jgi:hypothetical protein
MSRDINPQLQIRGPLKSCTYLVICSCAEYGGAPHWHYCQAAKTRLDPALLEERCWQHESKPLPVSESGESK